MWIVIQELLPVILIILFLTQLVIPLVFGGKTFWLFRPKTNSNPSTSTDHSTLLNEIKTTKDVVAEAKAKADVIITKVEDNLKSAEDLKKEADKLK